MRKRIDYIIIINAPTGEHRNVRGTIGRAIRDALGVRRWLEAPHYVEYQPSDRAGDFDARYALRVTAAEAKTLTSALEAHAAADGWDRAPFEEYTSGR